MLLQAVRSVVSGGKIRRTLIMHDNDNDNKQKNYIKSRLRRATCGARSEPQGFYYTCLAHIYMYMYILLCNVASTHFHFHFKYYEMHRIQSNHAGFDLLSRETCLTNQH